MKTLLVLAKKPGLPDALRAALDPERYRVVHYQEAWSAEPLFSRSAFDACFIDADLTDVRPVRLVEQLRQATPGCPIFIYASSKQGEWEEDAYLAGVEHVFTKPVRAKLLNSFLERSWKLRAPPASGPPAAAQPAGRPLPPVRQSPPLLEVLRNFSSILTHCLQTEPLLKQFLLLLREVINVNRAAVFLRQPFSVLGDTGNQAASRRLRSACALGLPASLLEHFALSADSGIGGYVYRHGRILKSGSEEARQDWEIQKEFELLGVQVAIPILDRESLLGVAVFDGRLTGEFFDNEELALIFHLLEELGLAIKSSWLHDELSSSHQMMADVLNQLGSGCVVVAKDLSILHSNQAAQGYFKSAEDAKGRLEFSDLPPALASKVYEALQTGTPIAPFRFCPDKGQETIYRVMISPFRRAHVHTPNAVMLLVEDFTQHERSQQLEIETANLRLVKAMAERLAHEIGNSLVPIFTYQQLMAQDTEDPEVQGCVTSAMTEGLRRISRLTGQMRYLARDQLKGADTFHVNQLVQDAFLAAQGPEERKPERLNHTDVTNNATLQGDFAGLKHALSEVFLNSLQSAPADKPIEVQTAVETDRHGARWLKIAVRDAGAGFTEEAAERAAEPFYTKRTVGLGLGLAVTRKILEIHKGRLEVAPSEPDSGGVVCLFLPLAGTGKGGGQARKTDD